MRVLIVGGGVAGVTAATKLRRLDENVEIVIFEKGENFGVASCALPDYFVGNIEKGAHQTINRCILIFFNGSNYLLYFI